MDRLYKYTEQISEGVLNSWNKKNDKHLKEMIKLVNKKNIILAWGNTAKRFPHRYLDVLQLILRYTDPYCLGVSEYKHPKHPLFLPTETPLVKWVKALP